MPLLVPVYRDQVAARHEDYCANTSTIPTPLPPSAPDTIAVYAPGCSVIRMADSSGLTCPGALSNGCRYRDCLTHPSNDLANPRHKIGRRSVDFRNSPSGANSVVSGCTIHVCKTDSRAIAYAAEANG